MRKNYLWYQFFRYGIVQPALNMFYTDITVNGREHIPEDKPTIFVANHQNSFLDPMHIVTNTDRFMHFLTRSNPFQNPVLALFLRSLNMLPVYRARDGFSTIKNNEETFKKCFNRLGNKDSIMVFVEASHDLNRRIRPINKGFTRIAFGAAQEYDWDLDIQILPIGMNYEQHQKSRTAVHVEFGPCIALSDFRDSYEKDERKAAQELKKEVAKALKKLTMHVPNLRHYPFYHLMLDELEENRRVLLNPRLMNKRVSMLKEKVDDGLVDRAENLLDHAHSRDLNLLNLVSPDKPGIKDLLLSPLYLFSLFNNALPYQAKRWLINHYIEDHVFDASAKFLVGLVLFPINYLIMATVLGFAGVSVPAILGYLFLSVMTAPMFVRAKDLIETSSIQRLENDNPALYKELKEEVTEFMKLRDAVLGKHGPDEASGPA